MTPVFTSRRIWVQIELSQRGLLFLTYRRTGVIMVGLVRCTAVVVNSEKKIARCSTHPMHFSLSIWRGQGQRSIHVSHREVAISVLMIGPWPMSVVNSRIQV